VRRLTTGPSEKPLVILHQLKP